jgi:hypothetical protein
MTLITDRESPITTIVTFNLLTRQWEQPQAQCALYPLALHTNVVNGGGYRVDEARYAVRESLYGMGHSSFGWLSWDGDMGVQRLATSLTLPGNSLAYINPNDPTDHTVSVGDWVLGRSEVTGSQVVSDALATLFSNHYKLVVPLWDQATNEGGTLRYRISGFAWVYGVEDYSVAQPNHIALRYWGPATCPHAP